MACTSTEARAVQQKNALQYQAPLSFSEYLSKLSTRAQASGISRECALYAAKQTSRYIRIASDELSIQEKKRIRSYYWAILKRQSAFSQSEKPLRDRKVLTTFVETLRMVGRSDEDIAYELERGFSQTMSSELVREYVTALNGLN